MDIKELPIDDRLKYLKTGQYRLWHDSHNILIPRGQSTTKKTEQEIVGANVRVYGDINNGFFASPQIDVTNTEVFTKRFDRFFIQTWRSGDELPIYDTRISYHEDLKLKTIRTLAKIKFSCYEFSGYFFNKIDFTHFYEGLWCSDYLPYQKYGDKNLSGQFFVVAKPENSDFRSDEGINFITNKFLQKDNLTLCVVLQSAKITNGNSEKMLLQRNVIHNVELESFEIDIKGGE